MTGCVQTLATTRRRPRSSFRGRRVAAAAIPPPPSRHASSSSQLALPPPVSPLWPSAGVMSLRHGLSTRRSYTHATIGMLMLPLEPARSYARMSALVSARSYRLALIWLARVARSHGMLLCGTLVWWHAHWHAICGNINGITRTSGWNLNGNAKQKG